MTEYSRKKDRKITVSNNNIKRVLGGLLVVIGAALTIIFGMEMFNAHKQDVAVGQNNLGSAWQTKGDYDKAIEYYEVSLRIF